MNSPLKIAIIGMGNIGEWILYSLCHHAINGKLSIDKLVCISTNIEKMESKVSDIKQALFLKLPNYGEEKVTALINTINCTKNYNCLHDVDYIITTYSFPMDSSIQERSDLLKKNDGLTQIIGLEIGRHASKKCRVINVTNPLDVMTWRLQHFSQLPHNQVVGLSGIIDSTRLAQGLHELLKIPYNKIDLSSLSVCGEHGPTMVPILSKIRIDGKPITLSEKQERQIIQFTRDKGTKMLLANNRIPPHISVAEGVAHCLMAWSSRVKSTLCLSTWCASFEAYVGAQVEISNQGLKYTNLFNELTLKEKKQLESSINTIKSNFKELDFGHFCKLG